MILISIKNTRRNATIISGIRIGMRLEVGGLFFDYLKPTDDRSMQDWYDFVTTVADSFRRLRANC